LAVEHGDRRRDRPLGTLVEQVGAPEEVVAQPCERAEADLEGDVDEDDGDLRPEQVAGVGVMCSRPSLSLARAAKSRKLPKIDQEAPSSHTSRERFC
jgi:hypothetical protein